MPRLIKVALYCDEPELAKRIRIAASLQAGNGFDVRLVDPSASSVDLAMIEADRPDADALVSRFRQADVLLVQLGQSDSARFSDHLIDGRQSIAVIQRRLRQLLSLAVSSSNQQIEPEGQPDSGAPAGRPLIVRLCEAGYVEADDLELRRGDLKVVLQRRRSRILASSASVVEQAAELIHKEGWALNAAPSADVMAAPGDFTGSLDGFLIQAALACRAELPAIEPNRFRLRAWPDLATCGQPAVVRMSALLVNGRWSAADLARHSGADGATVNACLWAMRAAALLDSDHTLAAAKPASAGRGASSRGLLSRLARHFGLGQLRAA